MTTKRYLSAQEAARLLGVKPTTLYAYVSRGLIRSEMADEAKRQRRYLAEDVHKLAERKEQRRDPAKVAQEALHWGTPVLSSALTLITEEGPFYRGLNACTLALERSFEEVAALLWTGQLDDAARLFTAQRVAASIDLSVGHKLPPMQAIQTALAAASAVDLGAYDLSPEAVAQTGTRILDLMLHILVDTAPQDSSIAATLAASWCADAERVLNAALILCADHELNASSFAARVVASVRSTPYAVVMAGLAALQGLRHGGNMERVLALLREVGQPDQARAVLAGRLQRGETLYGFDHRLYPEGDPRAVTLLTLLEQTRPQSPALALTNAVIREAEALVGKKPSIDLALAAMELTLELPRGAALSVFTLGRTAGWIAHAIEQYADQGMIRPRARYVGNPPER